MPQFSVTLAACLLFILGAFKSAAITPPVTIYLIVNIMILLVLMGMMVVMVKMIIVMMKLSRAPPSRLWSVSEYAY